MDHEVISRVGSRHVFRSDYWSSRKQQVIIIPSGRFKNKATYVEVIHWVSRKQQMILIPITHIV